MSMLKCTVLEKGLREAGILVSQLQWVSEG